MSQYDIWLKKRPQLRDHKFRKTLQAKTPHISSKLASSAPMSAWFNAFTRCLSVTDTFICAAISLPTNGKAGSTKAAFPCLSRPPHLKLQPISISIIHPTTDNSGMPRHLTPSNPWADETSCSPEARRYAQLLSLSCHRGMAGTDDLMLSFKRDLWQFVACLGTPGKDPFSTPI